MGLKDAEKRLEFEKLMNKTAKERKEEILKAKQKKEKYLNN